MFRKGLVTAQIAISLLLLISAVKPRATSGCRPSRAVPPLPASGGADSIPLHALQHKPQVVEYND